MNILKYSCLTLWLITTTFTTLQSQNIADTLVSNKFDLDEVVVTATRTPKKLSQSPVITQVITAKQIESRGLTDIKKLLQQEIPGLIFNEVDFGTSINLQGLGGKHILFLIDGERMSGETGDNIDYNRLNMNDVERIEIVQGASSALYGSQAMGGVINIITKSQKKKFYASANTKWSPLYERNYRHVASDEFHYTFKKNADRPNLNADLTVGGNWGKWSAKTNFSHKSADAYRLFNTDSIVKNFNEYGITITEPLDKTPVNVSGLSSLNFTQSLGFKPSKKLSFSAKGTFYEMNKYDLNADNKFQHNNDVSGVFKTHYQISEHSDIVFSFYGDMYDKYDKFEMLKDKKELVYTHRILQPRLLYSFRVGDKHFINTGLEYNDESLYADKFVTGAFETCSQQSGSFFVQDDWRFSNKFSIIGGFRIDVHNTYGVNISPKLAAIYKVFPYTLRFNYASGYRSPSLKELYMNWDHLGMFMIYGNKDLKPEQNQYFSFSAEYASRYVYAIATAYANFFTRKIEGIWTENQAEMHYRNINATTLAGANGNIRVNPFKNFYWHTAINYLIPSRKKGVRLTTQSPLSGNVRAEYQLKFRKHSVDFNLVGSIFGENKYSVLDKIQVNNVQTEAYYTAKVPTYSLWNLSVSYQFPKYARLTLGIDNVLDYKAKIINFNTYTGAGRSGFISLLLSMEIAKKSVN